MEYTNICEIEKNNSMRMSNQVANDISLQSSKPQYFRSSSVFLKPNDAFHMAPFNLDGFLALLLNEASNLCQGS